MVTRLCVCTLPPRTQEGEKGLDKKREQRKKKQKKERLEEEAEEEAGEEGEGGWEKVKGGVPLVKVRETTLCSDVTCLDMF